MRRSCLVVVLLVSAGSLSCRSADPRGPVFPDLHGGSPLVKAQIVLRDLEGRCVASVEPARMRVLQGGVLRWQVTNRCRRLEGKGQPALAVTRLKTNEDGRPASWLSEVCDAELALVELGTPLKGNVIHCDVPDEAPVGVYKYSLEGLIEPLDPVIEIIRPGGQG